MKLFSKNGNCKLCKLFKIAKLSIQSIGQKVDGKKEIASISGLLYGMCSFSMNPHFGHNQLCALDLDVEPLFGISLSLCQSVGWALATLNLQEWWTIWLNVHTTNPSQPSMKNTALFCACFCGVATMAMILPSKRSSTIQPTCYLRYALGFYFFFTSHAIPSTLLKFYDWIGNTVRFNVASLAYEWNCTTGKNCLCMHAFWLTPSDYNSNIRCIETGQ